MCIYTCIYIAHVFTCLHIHMYGVHARELLLRAVLHHLPTNNKIIQLSVPPTNKTNITELIAPPANKTKITQLSSQCADEGKLRRTGVSCSV